MPPAIAMQVLRLKKRRDVMRLINRLVLNGYWFRFRLRQGEYLIGISASVDLDRDIRRRLKELEFELLEIRQVATSGET